METPDKMSTAEVADRHMRFMAIAMLMVAFIFLSKAAAFFVGADVSHYLGLSRGVLFAAVLGLIAPVVLWKLRHRSADERVVYFREDGFAAHALVFAQKRSWVLTFVLITFLESSDRLLSAFPSGFFLQIVLAMMLGSVSLMFLYKTASDDGLDAEEAHG